MLTSKRTNTIAGIENQNSTTPKFVFLKIYLKSLDTDHMYYVLSRTFFHLVQSFNNDNVGTKGFYSSRKMLSTVGLNLMISGSRV